MNFFITKAIADQRRRQAEQHRHILEASLRDSDQHFDGDPIDQHLAMVVNYGGRLVRTYMNERNRRVCEEV